MDAEDTTNPPEPAARRLAALVARRGDDAQFEKPNQTIAIRPRSKGGRLTLLTRRIYNALLFHAQEQGGAGPYKIQLSELIGASHFNSNNTSVLKEYLREMQTTAIEWYSGAQGRRRWDSTQLLGPVSIEETGPGLPVVITWKFPEDLGNHLIRPASEYTKLLLEAGGQMRSYAAAVLFEVGMQYLTFKGGLTMREDVLWWAEVLTGRSEIKEVDYRYFKRDVIKRALVEVESLQDDFTLELIEHKQGKRVLQLQFRVNRKKQRALGVTETKNTFDLELVDRMRRLGVAQDDTEKLYVTTDEAVLRAGVAHLEERMANTNLTPIASPYRYLVHAIKQGFIETAEPAATTQRSAESAPPERVGMRASMQTIREEWLRDQASKAQRSFESRTPAECRELQRQFEGAHLPSQLDAIAKAWAKDGPRSKVAGPVFFRWLVTQWLEVQPTDAELIAFALDRGMLAVETAAP